MNQQTTSHRETKPAPPSSTTTKGVSRCEQILRTCLVTHHSEQLRHLHGERQKRKEFSLVSTKNAPLRSRSSCQQIYFCVFVDVSTTTTSTGTCSFLPAWRPLRVCLDENCFHPSVHQQREVCRKGKRCFLPRLLVQTPTAPPHPYALDHKSLDHQSLDQRRCVHTPLLSASAPADERKRRENQSGRGDEGRVSQETTTPPSTRRRLLEAEE